MADTKEIINCPACGCEMEKVFLPDAKFYVDVCAQGCGGIYFDNREFKKVDEAHEDISPIIEKLKDKELKPVDESQDRFCPVCTNKMVKNYSSHLKAVQVDECYFCGGKFLDAGELAKIRKEFKTEEDRISAFQEFAADLIREEGNK